MIDSTLLKHHVDYFFWMSGKKDTNLGLRNFTYTVG